MRPLSVPSLTLSPGVVNRSTVARIGYPDDWPGRRHQGRVADIAGNG